VGAQVYLGLMYAQGQGVAQDFAEALKWFQLAVERGDAGGQFNLGGMYFSGVGVSQDYREAAKLYQLSADQGWAQGQHALGLMYAEGEGLIEDYVLAYMWFDLAASQGFGPSFSYKAALAEKMTPDQIAKAEGMSANWVADFESRQTN